MRLLQVTTGHMTIWWTGPQWEGGGVKGAGVRELSQLDSDWMGCVSDVSVAAKKKKKKKDRKGWKMGWSSQEVVQVMRPHVGHVCPL